MKLNILSSLKPTIFGIIETVEISSDIKKDDEKHERLQACL